MHIVLLEPDAQGRVSGGYLYNRNLCAASSRAGENTLQRRIANQADLSVALGEGECTPRHLLLADSLFLTGDALEPLFRLRRATGCKLGCMLHALPSFIQRANLPANELGPEPWQPSAEELSLIARLDLLVAPGPFIPRLLRALGSATPCIQCLPGFARRATSARTGAAAPARIVSVATLAPNKGYLDAAAALALLPELPWYWQVVGSLDFDAEHVSALSAALAHHGLTDRVTLSGEQPSERIWDLLGGADLLLHPSYTENQPLIVMEALAAGVPVVGYRVGGMLDLVDGPRAGALVELREVSALADALRTLMTQRDVYAAASRAALESASVWPDWATSAAQLSADVSALFEPRTS